MLKQLPPVALSVTLVLEFVVFVKSLNNSSNSGLPSPLSKMIGICKRNKAIIASIFFLVCFVVTEWRKLFKPVPNSQ